MSIERELLQKVVNHMWQGELVDEIKELLAQPEQDQAGAVMPNGVCVSNVYDAYEEGRKSVMVEQEPVGYLYKQMDCYGEWATIFKVDKPYITWHDIKDIVPVYTAPPKPEQDNIQYLLDQVARLTAENAMLKEKWSTSKQPEQEPVAWIYEWVDEAGEPVKSVAYNFYDDANPIPLYTAPPTRDPLTPRQGLEEYKRGYARAELDLKREPLSDDEMRAIWKEGIRGEIPFVEIGRAIEKAHGITGVDDE